MSNSIVDIRKKYPARLTRGRAIKLHCKESCCAGDLESWKNCTCKSCFLWSFRLGKELGEGKDISSDKTSSILSKNKEISTQEGSSEGGSNE